VAEPDETTHTAQRVLLADADVQVRAALVLLLSREPRLRVAGQAADADELITHAKTSPPDLVVLEWELPGLHRGDTLLRLRSACPDADFIVLSVRPERICEALAGGFQTFVSKTDPPGRLVTAVRAVMARAPSG
jgi:DNA-binding NarL/FixJ family response regulator